MLTFSMVAGRGALPDPFSRRQATAGLVLMGNLPDLRRSDTDGSDRPGGFGGPSLAVTATASNQPTWNALG